MMILTAPALLMAAGCQTAQMRLPESFPAEERMAVQGRQGWRFQERLRFGPYEATRVQRSWTRGRDRQVSVARQHRRHQQYAFTLREEGRERWSVACDAWLWMGSVEVAGVVVEPVNTSELSCDLESLDGDGRGWTLDLSETRERPLRGTLQRGSTLLQVRGTNRLERGLPMGETSGYYLAHEGRTLAAVETINAGAVWLSREAEPELRGVLSATAAALLLLEDLRGTLPRD